uniref:Response regulatory domain-containing protein n=1 Tax=Bicosoecida sp. CB-2014 TaxID=1486930 RepID=A0A7S1CNT6_9STRA
MAAEREALRLPPPERPGRGATLAFEFPLAELRSDDPTTEAELPSVECVPAADALWMPLTGGAGGTIVLPAASVSAGESRTLSTADVADSVNVVGAGPARVGPLKDAGADGSRGSTDDPSSSSGILRGKPPLPHTPASGTVGGMTGEAERKSTIGVSLVDVGSASEPVTPDGSAHSRHTATDGAGGAAGGFDAVTVMTDAKGSLTTRSSDLLSSASGGAAASVADASAAVASGRITVLVVDDEAVNQRLARRILRRQGVRVIECSDGRGVLPALRRHNSKKKGSGTRIDVVFTDVNMADTSGTEALRIAREGGFGDVPFVVVTGDPIALQSEVLFGLQGFVAMLAKPYTEAELLATLGSVVPRFRPRGRGERSARSGESSVVATQAVSSGSRSAHTAVSAPTVGPTTLARDWM